MSSYGNKEIMPQASRNIRINALQTVKSAIDAAVELITNSNDSYNKLEGKKANINGTIELFVEYKKGGTLKKIAIKDFAQGMDYDRLKVATIYGEAASGFEIGVSVRGLFGRGMKEAIV